jgi:hypothetical protein
MTAPPGADEPATSNSPTSVGGAARRDPGSYRDPSGFVFERDGVVLRQIAPKFAEHWDRFLESGLYERLSSEGLLVEHEQVELDLAAAPPAHAVIRPQRIDPITYPYEWSFSQLKDAALLTLRVEELASEAGMTLRDASAYNVQFRHGRSLLIDSLSFEPALEGRAWQPYRQFCEHFLAPLALMARVDIRLGGLQREYIDGIPLDLTARLLPGRSRLSFGLGPHIHLHARAQRRHADDGAAADSKSGGNLSAKRRATLIESLRTTIEGLNWAPSGTEWADYADNTSYDEAATAAKAEAVRVALEEIGGTTAWDLGANTGRYARIAAAAGYSVVAADIDPAAVERAYLALRDGDTTILPLLVDLTDPSPAIGWGGVERRSLLDRANADVAIGLALVHHLAIGANVPLPMIAEVFADIAPHAIIEFVPKEDAMVRKLLASRPDIFPDYHLDGMRAAFDPGWTLVEETAIAGSQRTLLHFRRRDS